MVSSARTNVFACCEDSDFDGWGWDGLDCCRKAYRLQNSDVILPPIDSVLRRTEDLEGRVVQCNKFSYQDNGTFDFFTITCNFISQVNVLVSGGVFAENTVAQWFVTEFGQIGNWSNFIRPAYQPSAGYIFVSGFFINDYGPNVVINYDVCFPVGNDSSMPLRATR